MWVRYFVPEDGDDMNHPNVFRVNSNSITLGDLKKVRLEFSFMVLQLVKIWKGAQILVPPAVLIFPKIVQFQLFQHYSFSYRISFDRLFL